MCRKQRRFDPVSVCIIPGDFVGMIRVYAAELKTNFWNFYPGKTCRSGQHLAKEQMFLELKQQLLKRRRCTNPVLNVICCDHHFQHSSLLDRL